MSSILQAYRIKQILGLRVVFGIICLIALADAAKPEEAKAADEHQESSFEAYQQAIEGTKVTFEMVPIPGGTCLLGSPRSEIGRKDDEGPRYEVAIEPFWMGKCEVTWDEFLIFTEIQDIKNRRLNGEEAPNDTDRLADAVARPTQAYIDMSFEMGKNGGFPAIAMSHFAARVYCKWLSAKTGHYYRLPTEAEWEYACRAGSTTAYSFGDGEAKLAEYAWYTSNSGDAYKKVGQKKPNAWGLHDMHGNVGEWVLDQYLADARIRKIGSKNAIPFAPTTKKYPNVARGGSWDSDAAALRCAARLASSEEWNGSDPQAPPSEWYTADRQDIGFRIVRPLREPTAEEKAKVWDAGLDFNKQQVRVRTWNYELLPARKP